MIVARIMSFGKTGEAEAPSREDTMLLELTDKDSRDIEIAFDHRRERLYIRPLWSDLVRAVSEFGAPESE